MPKKMTLLKECLRRKGAGLFIIQAIEYDGGDFMRNIKILTDSCSDLNGELLEKYNIDYARMNTVRDGVETEASLTWEH